MPHDGGLLRRADARVTTLELQVDAPVHSRLPVTLAVVVKLADALQPFFVSRLAPFMGWPSRRISRRTASAHTDFGPLSGIAVGL